MSDSSVAIKDALFCQRFQQCAICSFDGREGNDGFSGSDPIDREGIEAPTSSVDKDSQYQCKKHGSAACSQCYGWKKQIRRASSSTVSSSRTVSIAPGARPEGAAALHGKGDTNEDGESPETVLKLAYLLDAKLFKRDGQMRRSKVRARAARSRLYHALLRRRLQRRCPVSRYKVQADKRAGKRAMMLHITTRTTTASTAGLIPCVQKWPTNEQEGERTSG
ncbi:hypothetical protein FOMPIDRAFT_1124442 [Fomitopsis schrenkii]|uniref:Uncharacterized protein n=1 Tax=Fomitopsis schrenkii TaxID=2126942 RepID=S8FM53_FOMSC|nr:hypothetical protein FOMPIDRAFT_1124420 [Fomitopsis schrenkii]EPS99384.1 hypothetical protein FOMPIDRAFT_1124442 [Fomitopsis schrenkii]